MFDRLIAKSPFAKVVTAALEEARRRGNRRLGTEHLLLGLLHDPGSLPARALGVDLESARAALDALDEAALDAIGIEVGNLQRSDLAPRKHPPLTLSATTSSARAALDQSIKATTMKTRHVGPDHLLLALLACERPDPVVELMAELNIDRSAVRSRIDQSPS
jgi:ATP-dependent Clp protease ATP-binding subunit ClpA